MENNLLNFLYKYFYTMIVALTQKLDVSTTFFGGGYSNCCSSLLTEAFVADWLEFWIGKSGL